MTGEQDTDTTERLPANDRILLPFEVAFEKLRERFPDTTLGEVVMWVSHSYPFSDDADRREDVLPAYRRAMLPDDPDERSAVAVHGTEFLTGDTASSLYKIHDLFFSPKVLDAFKPSVRWLTYEQLTNRWGCSQSFIEERIQQTGNSPFEFWPHPLYQDAPLSESMFLLERVEKVEVRFGLSVCGSRLPSLESGLPFREMGWLGKLPEKATGPVKSKLEEVEQRRIRGPKNPCAIHYWTTLSSWTLEQAAFILLGYEPISAPDVKGVPFPWTEADSAVYRLYESLLSAVDDGTLAAKPFTRNDRDGHRVRPVEVYGWLQRNYGEKVYVSSALVEFFATNPVVPRNEQSVQSEQGAAAKQAALAQLLDELDKRANEKGVEFDRHSLPGTKEEFSRLLKSHCPVFKHVVTTTVADYLKGKCRFQRGAKTEQGKGAAVWALFPEYDLK